VGFNGIFTVLNAAAFDADIAQACALYGASAGRLVCVGNESLTYAGASPCAACPTGHYATASGSTACTLCGVGAYAPAGGTSCVACPTNTNSTAAGAGDATWLQTVSLPNAQYAASSSSVATGYALNSTGWWVATRGDYTWQNAWLRLDLLAVLPVKAVVTQGGGTTYVTTLRVDASATGATWTTVVNYAKANTDASGLVTTPLPAGVWARYLRLYVQGFYQTPALRAGVVLGLSGCACAPGYYAGVSYAAGVLSECAPCAAGTYSTSAGAQSNSTCVACGAGTYFTGVGATACAACGAGTYATAEGAQSSLICAACDAGTYSTALGAWACQGCAAGTRSTALGAASVSTCAPCAAGTSSSNGSTACAACADNATFNNVSGGLCVPCAAGAYSAPDRLRCLPCPVNAYGVGCRGACPPNTRTLGNGTASALGCLCLGGYACVYTKRIHVGVRLADARNLTAFIARLANATGVPISSITVLSQTPSSHAQRRLLGFAPAHAMLRERLERGHVHHHYHDDAWPDDLLVFEVHGVEAAPSTLPHRWRHAHTVRVMRERAFW
jgi:syndecan 4